MRNFELTVKKGNKIISTLKKYYNGTWDAASKTWIVEVKEKDEEVFLANFSEYIIEEKEEITTETTKRRFVSGNHATPGHFVYGTGNYGDDVLSGFYQEG